MLKGTPGGLRSAITHTIGRSFVLADNAPLAVAKTDVNPLQPLANEQK